MRIHDTSKLYKYLYLPLGIFKRFDIAKTQQCFIAINKLFKKAV